MGRKRVAFAVAVAVLLAGAWVALRISGLLTPMPPSRPEHAAQVAGASTPEEAFSGAIAAADRNDWRGFLELTDPGSVDMFLMTMSFAAGTSARGDELAVKEFDAIGAKHRIRATDPSDLPVDDRMAMRDAARRMFAHVESKPALLADLMDFLTRHGKGAMAAQFPGAVLKEIRITGDTARGSFEDRSARRSPIDFVKRGGRWFLAFST